MVLACEQPMTGYHETNFSMAYSSHISWQTPDSPVPMEVYPSLAFDNLFENRGSLRNLSILDRVKDRRRKRSTRRSARTDKAQARRVSDERARGGEARRRDAQEQGQGGGSGQGRRTGPSFTMERPANGLPEDLREHTRLMCDIIAIAFQTDKTRVATLLLAAIFRRSTIRSSTCATATTRRRTTTSPTATSASRGST